MPKADLPFTQEFLAFVGDSLFLAGLPSDRPWLVVPSRLSERAMLRSDQSTYYKAARERVPQSDAYWELGPFFQAAMPAAAFDLSWPEVESFWHFSFLYERLLGEAAVPYLPSLLSAAVLVPSRVAGDERSMLSDVLTAVETRHA